MSVADYYDRQAADYHKQYDGTTEDYPANAIRLKHIISRLKSLGAKTVFEIGVGEGTPLVEIAKLGINIHGCDISQEMVKQAKENLKRRGLSPDRIWDDVHFKEEDFDAVIATGVLPHTDDAQLISDINGLLRPGGSAIVEFRNSLFSMFSFNKHSFKFFLDDLLKDVSEDCRLATYSFLVSRFNLSQPPQTEFEAISRFHNPFELQETFAKHGFQTTGFIWYHAHPAPPQLEKEIGEDFRAEALKLEGKNDWRGMFMCSAGLIEVKKQ